MFDALFAFVGPVGAAVALFAVVLPPFLLAAVETIRLARPFLTERWASLAGGLGAIRISRAWIARAGTTDDSRDRHAFRLSALVRHRVGLLRGRRDRTTRD
jgi:hypothetical protein